MNFGVLERFIRTNRGTSLQDAVDLARQNYPALAEVDPDAILFYVSVRVKGDATRVCISPSAWEEVTSGLPQYEILDVEVSRSKSRASSPSSKPHLFVENAEDAPPRYEASSSSGSHHLDAKGHRGRPTNPAPERPRSPNIMGKTMNFLTGKKQ